MFLSEEMTELMEEPIFRPVMRGVVKEVIQHLLESLARHTGDESILLIASTTGPITGVHNAASGKGKTFISGRGDITSSFFDFCKKKPKRGRPSTKGNETETPATPNRTPDASQSTTTRQTPISTRGTASTPILSPAAIKQEKVETRTPIPSKHFTRSKGQTPKTTKSVAATITKTTATRPSKDTPAKDSTPETPAATKEKEKETETKKTPVKQSPTAEKATTAVTEDEMETEEAPKDSKTAILQSLQLKSASSSGPTRIKVVHQAPVPSTSKEGQEGDNDVSQCSKMDDDISDDDLDDTQDSIGDMTGDLSDDDDDDEEDFDDDDDIDDDDDEEEEDSDEDRDDDEEDETGFSLKKTADKSVGATPYSTRYRGALTPKTESEKRVKVMVKRTPGRPKKIGGKDVWPCEYCGRILKTSRQYKEHVIDHTGELPKHQCDICQKRFKRGSDMRNHRARHLHPSRMKKQYICAVCDKDCKNKRMLVEHMFDHSDAPKPFPCDICSKTFKRRTAMRNHRLVHFKTPKPKVAKNKEIVCEYCGKCYKAAKQYREHRMNHTGEKRPFPCEACNKSFKRRREMLDHYEATHLNQANRKCKICDKAYKWRKMALDCAKKHKQAKDEIMEALQTTEADEIVIQADEATYQWLVENQGMPVVSESDNNVVFVFQNDADTEETVNQVAGDDGSTTNVVLENVQSQEITEEQRVQAIETVVAMETGDYEQKPEDLQAVVIEALQKEGIIAADQTAELMTVTVADTEVQTDNGTIATSTAGEATIQVIIGE